MRHFCFLLLCIFISLSVSSQHVYKIKTDSLLVTNDSCTAELNLENSTKFVNGFLYNKGKGRTEFRRAMIKLTDSTYLFGDDTLNFRSLLNTIGFSGANIYNANGSLTGDRIVTLGTNRLSFSTDGSFRNSFSGSPFSFQIADDAGWDLGIMRFGANGGPPNLIFMKTRGASANADASLVNNDFLMRIAAVGVNSSNLLPGQESLRIFAGAYPTGGVANFSNGAVPPTSEVPTSFNIATSGITGGLLSRFTIYPDGEIILANMGATPGATSTQIISNRYKLQVFGSSSITGNLLLNATQGATAHSSAQFEMVSTTKGFLPPRWTKTQRTAITTPAIALIGYQTDSSENLYLNKSTGWKKILTEDNLSDATNIYNANGSLISNRFVNLDTSLISFGKNSTTYLHLFNNGNLWIGNNSTPADSGYKLDIAGPTRIVANPSSSPNIIFLASSNGTFRNSMSGASFGQQVVSGVGRYGMGIVRTGANAGGASLTFVKTRSDDANQNLPLVNGDNIMSISGWGVAADGGTTSFGQAAFSMTAQAYPTGGIANFSSGAVPATTELPVMFRIGTRGISGGLMDRFAIFPDGQVILANTNNMVSGFTSNNYKMQVYGNGSVHGSFLVNETQGSSNQTSAILEASSTSKGFLPPRMTGAQAEAISSPAEGLMIYATNGNGTVITSKGWWGFNGTTWEKLNN